MIAEQLFSGDRWEMNSLGLVSWPSKLTDQWGWAGDGTPILTVDVMSPGRPVGMGGRRNSLGRPVGVVER